MTLRSRDTDKKTFALQAAAWREMGPSGRLDLMASLSEELITLTQAGIRARHPEYSEDAVRLAEIRLRLGDELFGKAFPNAPKWDS